jgi:hypothetical protein
MSLAPEDKVYFYPRLDPEYELDKTPFRNISDP